MKIKRRQNLKLRCFSSFILDFYLSFEKNNLTQVKPLNKVQLHQLIHKHFLITHTMSILLSYRPPKQPFDPLLCTPLFLHNNLLS